MNRKYSENIQKYSSSTKALEMILLLFCFIPVCYVWLMLDA
jgi:hypothetical protein